MCIAQPSWVVFLRNEYGSKDWTTLKYRRNVIERLPYSFLRKTTQVGCTMHILSKESLGIRFRIYEVRNAYLHQLRLIKFSHYSFRSVVAEIRKVLKLQEGKNYHCTPFGKGQNVCNLWWYCLPSSGCFIKNFVVVAKFFVTFFTLQQLIHLSQKQISFLS